MVKNLRAKIDCRNMAGNEIIDTILNDRGIDNFNDFFKPQISDMLPFEQMKCINEAYQIIDDGVTMDENFLVLFDCDLDGVSAGAIITRYLRMMGARVKPIINNGKKHGVENFDLNTLNGIDIMIIVDSLNSNPDDYKRIIDTGCQLIILDHHIPSKAILHSDVPFVLVSSAVDYDNNELSGAGVALKMVLYCDEQNDTHYANSLWWYAAVGIVGDMTSVATPENRYIISRGLAQYQHPIVQKLIGGYLFNTEAISFSIAPLINAAIRMYNNNTAMEMFLADDDEYIDYLYKDLKRYREEQNAIVDKVLPQLISQGEKQLDKKFMVFYMTGDYVTLTGLLGNRLLSIYQRPLIVVKDYGTYISGSMRAIGVENFMKMVNDTHLAQCDGHELAAGFTCDKNKFAQFKDVIEHELEDVEFSVDVIADVEIDIEQIDDYLIKQLGFLNRMSGKGFPPITVLVRTHDYEVSTFTTKKHLKIIDRDTGVLLVKWNDLSWKTMKNDKEFVGIGTISSAHYGKTTYNQVVLDDYTLLTK